ncbi:MAG TPA: ParB/RepB/Spo0J family partition protein [Candidatus Bathyarchaeia archaeon]
MPKVISESILAEDESAIESPTPRRAIKDVPVSKIRPSRFQTRETSVADVTKLAKSIERDGLLQPISVTPVEDDLYEVVHGHRRLAACKQLDWKLVPCIVEKKTDEEQARIVLTENLQRKDLNALEEARGYKALRDEFHYSLIKIARMIGKSRPHVSNRLRLLEADPAIADAVSRETITVAHALLAMAVPPVFLVSRFVDLIGATEATVEETERMLTSLRNGNWSLVFNRSVDPRHCREYVPRGCSASPVNWLKVRAISEEGLREEVFAFSDGTILQGLEEVKAAQTLNWKNVNVGVFVPTSYLKTPDELRIFQATDQEWPMVLRSLKRLVSNNTLN